MMPPVPRRRRIPPPGPPHPHSLRHRAHKTHTSLLSCALWLLRLPCVCLIHIYHARYRRLPPSPFPHATPGCFCLPSAPFDSFPQSPLPEHVCGSTYTCKVSLYLYFILTISRNPAPPASIIPQPLYVHVLAPPRRLRLPFVYHMKIIRHLMRITVSTFFTCLACSALPNFASFIRPLLNQHVTCYRLSSASLWDPACAVPHNWIVHTSPCVRFIFRKK